MTNSKLTYNAIIESYGEETGLRYEALVNAIIEGMDHRPEALMLASTVENLHIAQALLDIAKKHAVQEVEDAKIMDEFMAESTKSCTKCGQIHLREDFPTNSRNKDGKDRWCMACVLDYRAKRKSLVAQESARRPAKASAPIFGLRK